MTEAEWLTSTDPWKMLDFVRERTSERKLRLLACACCWHDWRMLSKASRSAVEVAELFADGIVSDANRVAAARVAIEAACAPKNGYFQDATDMGYKVAINDGGYACKWAFNDISDVDAAATLVRDVFGNLHRECAIESCMLTWNDACVLKIAQVIYTDRRFEDMPILADALEEAGCDNAAILQHCRSGEPHVRGCWVLDLLLGKE